MHLLDRYIFREWLKIFAMTISALVGLMLIGRIFDDMPHFIRWDVPGLVALRYFALQVPSYLPMVIPVALLISVLFILGFFHRNQELTAMRATGLSIFRITRVLWLSGAALSILLFSLNGTIVPWATERARMIYEAGEFEFVARKPTDNEKMPGQMSLFYAGASVRRTWTINRFSGYTGRGIGVSIYQDDEQGRPVKAWLAHFGYYDARLGHWVLEDGRELIYDPEKNQLLREPPFKRLELKELTEQPRLMLALNKKPHHLSINEIKGVLEMSGGGKTPRMAAYAVQYHYVLASPFCCLIVIGLALPFAVAGVRVNPMVGVSKSLVLFAAYYLLTNLCFLLGSQQYFPPVIAAWLPNLFMFALAAWLCRRVN
ncbi:MAG: LptF/LptG family permease [Puniceicoccales bacterium]|jgi:lipopolysaccharide export system permease protein|nr:LptF/LptG family permease [Puniceicoccales bacterium]